MIFCQWQHPTRSQSRSSIPFSQTSPSFRGFFSRRLQRRCCRDFPSISYIVARTFTGGVSISHRLITTWLLCAILSLCPLPNLSRPQVSVVIYDNDGGCYRDCIAGTWASPYNGSYECASCNPGYYCSGGCADPVACGLGTSFGEFGGEDSNDCVACSPGYYASEVGSASCSPCPAGHSCSSATSAPVACPVGTSASAGAQSCSDCADGYYNALEAQEFCQACPAGHECPDKTSEPTRCSSGSYSFGNATACETCPAGYYCSSTGSSPEVCTEGSYSLDNWAYCVSCPPGQYCLNTAQVCVDLATSAHT